MLINICGTGRSGTTILKEILCQRGDIGFARGRELRFLVEPDGFLSSYRKMIASTSYYEQDKTLNKLDDTFRKIAKRSLLYAPILALLRRSKLQKHLGFNITPSYLGISGRSFLPRLDDYYQDFLKDIKTETFSGSYIGSEFLSKRQLRFHTQDVKSIKLGASSFIRNYIHALANGCTHAIEDNPFSFYYRDEFEELVADDVKFVFVYRDPRDIVASSLSQPWAPSDVRQCCEIVRNSLESAATCLKSGDMIVKLDEFIEKPEQILGKVEDHCSLERFQYDLRVISSSSVGRHRHLPPNKIKILNEYFENYKFSMPQV